MIRRPLAFLLPAVCCLLAAPAASAQPCEPGWQPTAGLPGVDYRIYTTTTWDPDGPGPEAPRVVIGGRFEVAGTTLASNIAAWNSATGEWDDLGGGVNDEVLHVAGLDDGGLVAAGDFTQAGGVAADRIARWDGERWSPLGPGFTHDISALHALPGGAIVVAEHNPAGLGLSARISMWNDGAWSQLGDGINNRVYAITSLPGGDLVMGGVFSRIGSRAINRLARWDGAEWHAMGAGPLGIDPRIFALTTLPSGDLIAAGRFTSMDGVEALRVARWDGERWSAVADGLDGDVYAAVALPSGDVVFAGEFTDAGGITGADYIARWDGAEWHALGAAAATSVLTLSALPGGQVIAAGCLDGAHYSFRTAYRPDVALWDGSAWNHLGKGLSSSIRDLAVTAAADVVAAGDFLIAGGALASHIAIQENGSWRPLSGSDGAVAVAVHPAGDIFASTVHRAPGSNVMRWDGAMWSPVGGPIDGLVWDLLVTSAGDLLAGGSFSQAGGATANAVARWDGDAWQPMGESPPGFVTRLVELPDGHVCALGKHRFTHDYTPYIARWDGSAWAILHVGVADTGATAIAVDREGDLVAAFRPYYWDENASRGYLARWADGRWRRFATGLKGDAEQLVQLPSGDFIVGGPLLSGAGPLEVNKIARWDGVRWHDMDGGMEDQVYALAVMPDGDLIVGGRFLLAGDQVSPHFARWGCPDEPCYADCDRSGDLTFFDFLCFQNLFAAMDPGADCDGDTAFTFLDFLCFQDSFVAGCP